MSLSVPNDIMAKDIRVPTAPNSIMVIKLRKNCFFFTWNLKKKKRKEKKSLTIMINEYVSKQLISSVFFLT